MRTIFALPLLATLALAPVSAQDGCTQASPCEWVVVVGADGFLESEWIWTEGDWLQLVVDNGDDVAHTVTIEGAGIAVTAADLDETSSTPFQLEAGAYTLRDQPSGHTASASVVEGDAVDAAAASSSNKGMPGFEAVLAFAAIGLALFVRRR
ncbi:MAG: hypothetical protein AABX89_02645 [Candidatus Thermoplasmatota archaeon]